jgi:hypothetical protein
VGGTPSPNISTVERANLPPTKGPDPILVSNAVTFKRSRRSPPQNNAPRSKASLAIIKLWLTCSKNRLVKRPRETTCIKQEVGTTKEASRQTNGNLII